MRLVHRLSVLRSGTTPVATTRGQNQLREASGSGSAIPQGASCRAGMGWCPLPSSQTLLSKAPLREGVPSPFLAPPPSFSAATAPVDPWCQGCSLCAGQSPGSWSHPAEVRHHPAGMSLGLLAFEEARLPPAPGQHMTHGKGWPVWTLCPDPPGVAMGTEWAWG